MAAELKLETRYFISCHSFAVFFKSVGNFGAIFFYVLRSEVSGGCNYIHATLTQGHFRNFCD